mgnify:CR=1 FL=1
MSDLERQAVAEAERTKRSLTNGDFCAGLDGWNIEGGAGSFRIGNLSSAQARRTAIVRFRLGRTTNRWVLGHVKTDDLATSGPSRRGGLDEVKSGY